MAHQSHQKLLLEIKDAKKLVNIGSLYHHYKYPDKQYRVLDIGIQEESEKVCIIYCDLISPNLHFVRDLDSWLAQINLPSGQTVPRFEYIGKM